MVRTHLVTAVGFKGWFVTHRQGFIPASTRKGKPP
jgi:hypothetical protein